MSKAKQRSDGLIFLGLGIAIFALFGGALRFTASDAMADFGYIYRESGALLAHRDPYNPSESGNSQRAQISQEEQQKGPQRIHPVSMNLPTMYLIAVPFALLPFGVASTLWMILTGLSLALAGGLIWKQSAVDAPRLSGVLVGLLLMSGAVQLANGNAAGMVTGLCAIGTWCLLSNRYPTASVLCFAISLLMKPHDVVLVWFYFFLAGALSRKRSLQVLAICALFSLPAVLWVSHVAPNWTTEFRAHLAASSARGADSDPGPSGLTTKKRAIEEIIDLQAVISILRDDPRFYNPATYLICGVLLILWLMRAVRRNASSRSDSEAWFALAAVVPLTLLVTYHRAYDARLLLLTVPACCMLWARERNLGRVAVLINIAAFVSTGEIPLAILNRITRGVQPDTVSLPGQIKTLVIMRPGSIALLAMAIFYLWVYLRRNAGEPEVNVLDEAVTAAS